jgi:hypothetical protein
MCKDRLCCRCSEWVIISYELFTEGLMVSFQCMLCKDVYTHIFKF